MTRRHLAVLLPLAAMAALWGLSLLREEQSRTPWDQLAVIGCSQGAFGIPVRPLPRKVAEALGEDVHHQIATMRNAFVVALNEIPPMFFPDTQINLNCDKDAYLPSGVNIYVVNDDRMRVFDEARGRILVYPGPGNIVIFGDEFWWFFLEAWEPIIGWSKEVEGGGEEAKLFIEAHAEYLLEPYGLFLEWALAHELAHLKLGHVPAAMGADFAQLQRMELEADIEAMRTLSENYHPSSGHLLGLLAELMKQEFGKARGRAWETSDGKPFDVSWAPGGTKGVTVSPWRIPVLVSDAGHPPVILRTLSMLEASATVALERKPDSSWSRSVLDLVREVRGHLVVRYETRMQRIWRKASELAAAIRRTLDDSWSRDGLPS